MEFKGTKGKWRIKNLLNSKETEVVTDTYRICEVKHFDEQIDEVLIEPTLEECKANALLISKAPEMMEELKHLVRALKTVSSFGATASIIEHAENLIKEATELK